MKRQRVRQALLLLMLLIFPITFNFFSPYLIILGASEGVVSGSFVLFSLLFLGSLVFGRAFCGWVCPGGSVQELCFAVNDKRLRGRTSWTKYLVWVPWVIGIVAAAASAGGLRQINPLYMTETGISIDGPAKYIMYYFVLTVFVSLSLLIGKRAGCHHICWMAPFMIIGNKLRRIGKWPSLHLEADASKCTDCKQCDRKCPMSLAVNSMVSKGDMQHDECILCGNCVDNCPKHAIRYAYKWSKQRKFRESQDNDATISAD